jgi:hypothetical protein
MADSIWILTENLKKKTFANGTRNKQEINDFCSGPMYSSTLTFSYDWVASAGYLER